MEVRAGCLQKRSGVDPLRHLVCVVHGRQARPDIQELADAGLTGQVADRPGQEVPDAPGDVHDARVDGAELVAGRLVDRVVVRAAQPVVPDTGGVRHRGVYSWIVNGHGEIPS